MNIRGVRLALAALAAAWVGACGVSNITDARSGLADSSTANLNGRRAAESGVKLLPCSSSESETSSALLTAAGGVLSAGGVVVVVPEGALLAPTTLTLTVPPSKYMEIDVTALGFEHFTFQLPVVVTVSYARCPSVFVNTPVSAWYIDSQTKELLEDMGGVDNKLLRTVTFSTGHLSGYALAN